MVSIIAEPAADLGESRDKRLLIALLQQRDGRAETPVIALNQRQIVLGSHNDIGIQLGILREEAGRPIIANSSR